MAAMQQSELWDAQAMASAAKESAEHLAELRNHGMLGVQRAVTARAVALADAPEVPPGSETKVLHLVRHGQGFHSKRPQKAAGTQPDRLRSARQCLRSGHGSLGTGIVWECARIKREPETSDEIHRTRDVGHMCVARLRSVTDRH